MEKNVGTIDRVIRIVVGIVLLSLLFIETSFSKFGYIGFIPLLTGAFGYCPFYSILKIKTN